MGNLSGVFQITTRESINNLTWNVIKFYTIIFTCIIFTRLTKSIEVSIQLMTLK